MLGKSKFNRTILLLFLRDRNRRRGGTGKYASSLFFFLLFEWAKEAYDGESPASFSFFLFSFFFLFVLRHDPIVLAAGSLLSALFSFSSPLSFPAGKKVRHVVRH